MICDEVTLLDSDKTFQTAETLQIASKWEKHLHNKASETLTSAAFDKLQFNDIILSALYNLHRYATN